MDEEVPRAHDLADRLASFPDRFPGKSGDFPDERFTSDSSIDQVHPRPPSASGSPLDSFYEEEVVAKMGLEEASTRYRNGDPLPGMVQGFVGNRDLICLLGTDQ